MAKKEEVFTKGVLEDEFVKAGMYSKPQITAQVTISKEAYDKVKSLAGFGNNKVSAKVVLESALRQLSGTSPKNFHVLKD